MRLVHAHVLPAAPARRLLRMMGWVAVSARDRRDATGESLELTSGAQSRAPGRWRARMWGASRGRPDGSRFQIDGERPTKKRRAFPPQRSQLFDDDILTHFTVRVNRKSFGRLNGEAGLDLLKPAANDLLQRWRVSRRVNSSRAPAEDASLIEAVDGVSVYLIFVIRITFP